jgi:hypothetical protein
LNDETKASSGQFGYHGSVVACSSSGPIHVTADVSRSHVDSSDELVIADPLGLAGLRARPIEALVVWVPEVLGDGCIRG